MEYAVMGRHRTAWQKKKKKKETNMAVIKSLPRELTQALLTAELTSGNKMAKPG